MLTVRLLKKPVAGHNDLIFQLDGITEIRYLDAYYFAIELRSRRDFETSIAEAIAILLDDWVVQLNKMKEGGTIYLPIDFSDQYTGCIRVVMKFGELNMDYGCIRISGLDVCSMSPDFFYTTNEKYLPDTSKDATIPLSHFCKEIKTEADNLRNKT